MLIYSGGSRISRRGGVELIGRPWTPKVATFHKILYVKMKELGPLWGVYARCVPPGSANDIIEIHITYYLPVYCIYKLVQMSQCSSDI